VGWGANVLFRCQTRGVLWQRGTRGTPGRFFWGFEGFLFGGGGGGGGRGRTVDKGGGGRGRVGGGQLAAGRKDLGGPGTGLISVLGGRAVQPRGGGEQGEFICPEEKGPPPPTRISEGGGGGDLARGGPSPTPAGAPGGGGGPGKQNRPGWGVLFVPAGRVKKTFFLLGEFPSGIPEGGGGGPGAPPRARGVFCKGAWSFPGFGGETGSLGGGRSGRWAPGRGGGCGGGGEHLGRASWIWGGPVPDPTAPPGGKKGGPGGVFSRRCVRGGGVGGPAGCWGEGPGGALGRGGGGVWEKKTWGEQAARGA